MSKPNGAAPTSVFDEIKKTVVADSYIIEGNNRSRHVFRYLPASQIYQNLTEMDDAGTLGTIFPKLSHPEKYHGYIAKMYEQATIGQCDDEGFVKTKDREHAKIILKSYRSSLDPKARMHALSLPIDPSEPIDHEKASWHAPKSKETDRKSA